MALMSIMQMTLTYFGSQQYQSTMPKTQQHIPTNSYLHYQELYIQERKLKEQFQKRAQKAQLKSKTIFQTLNPKCLQCSTQHIHHKQQQISQLKQFKFNLNLKNSHHHPNAIIENFAVFGSPQSLLTDPDELEFTNQGQLLYVSDCPTQIAQHSAKLAFPDGNTHQFYHGSSAREKAIEIMSSNCSLVKTFVMNFQPGEEPPNNLELLSLLNPDNRIYAICLKIKDFTVVANQSERRVESQKKIQPASELSQGKVLSCNETDISLNDDQLFSIVTSNRVYCIFSKFPFFSFYEQFLKSMLNLIKTQRLVIYRESGSNISEADSHFSLCRIKQTFRSVAQQFHNWQLSLNKQLQIKLVTHQKIYLHLSQENCKNNFIENWGLPIFQLFTVDKFIEVFTLMMLEEKIVFICDNEYILTFAVHLFTRILSRPFQYPYPSVYLLPNEEQYLNAPFPIAYGLYGTKADLERNKLHEQYRNVYIILNRSGVEIVSSINKKSVLKKCSPILKDQLMGKFKSTSLKVEEDNCIGILKDKSGTTLGIINEVYSYLNNTVKKNLPSEEEMKEIQEHVNSSKPSHKDQTQQAHKQFVRRYSDKVKDPFYNALLQTQLINTYLFA